MAPLKPACIALMAGFLAQTFAPAVRFAFAEEAQQVQGNRDARDGALARSIDSALLTGQFKQAAVLLARSANAGNAAAQYQLASLYRLGRGVPPDEALAFKWMRAAAEQGHLKAKFNLGAMYLAGRGVDRDIGRARTWLLEAAAQGSQDASLLLASLVTARSKEAAGSKSATPAAQDTLGAQSQNTAPAPRTIAENGRPVILDAASRGQADAILQLVTNGADIAARDADGNTALALAAAAGRVEAMDVLLSAGASADTKSSAGRCAPHGNGGGQYRDVVQRRRGAVGRGPRLPRAGHIDAPQPWG
jgi:uncharacterized protein